MRSNNLELDPDLNEILMLHAVPHLTEQQKCKHCLRLQWMESLAAETTEHRSETARRSYLLCRCTAHSLLMPALSIVLVISNALKVEQTPSLSLSSFNSLTLSFRHSLTINPEECYINPEIKQEPNGRKTLY